MLTWQQKFSIHMKTQKHNWNTVESMQNQQAVI